VFSWEKKGLIYCPKGEFGWNNNTFMTPTPFQLNDETIRLFGGVRDQMGVSRITYIDLNADNPAQVKKVSDRVVLDIGEPGCFDDNGVILGDVIRVGSKIYMYYVGFQLVQKVKFLAFSGLAISDDNGETFKRHSKAPVLDRTDTGPYIRAIHSVMVENGIFRVWYSVDKGWQIIDGLPYPAYHIWYTESPDGIYFPAAEKTLCIDTEGSEYRIGRPRVYKIKDTYLMYYTRDFLERNYLAGFARSTDGKIWQRDDAKLGIGKSETGWDSEMLCYPVLFPHKNKMYMFYSGNEFGKTGIGFAEAII